MTFEEYLQAGRKAGDKDLLLVEKELSKMYLEAFKDTSRELEVFLAKGFSPEEVRKYGRLAQLLDGINTEYKKLTGKALDLTITASSDAFLESWKSVEWALDSANGVSLKWGFPPVDAIRASIDPIETAGMTLEKIFGVNYTAELSRIQGAITRGIIQGKGYVKVARELRDGFNKGLSDALRVVRTNGTRAWTNGQLSAIQKANDMGIKTRTRWVAALDSRTREAHAMLDGEYADEDGLFWIGSDSAKGPGLFSEPENSINCRCTIIQELEDLPSEIRRIDDEIQPYQDYKTWASSRGWTEESGWPKVKTV